MTCKTLEEWHANWRLVPFEHGGGAVECIDCGHMSAPWDAKKPFDHARGCRVAVDTAQFPWADLGRILMTPGTVQPRSALESV